MTVPCQCPDCDALITRREPMIERFLYGAQPNQVELEVEVMVEVCDGCGAMMTDGEQGAKRDAAVKKYLESRG